MQIESHLEYKFKAGRVRDLILPFNLHLDLAFYLSFNLHFNLHLTR